MKLHRLLILSGLLVGVVPTPAFAECVPACAPGVSCRVLQQGPPAVFGCPTAVRGVRGPTGTLTAQQGSGSVTGKGSIPDSSTARTTGSKNSASPPAALGDMELMFARAKARREPAAAKGKTEASKSEVSIETNERRKQPQ